MSDKAVVSVHPKGHGSAAARFLPPCPRWSRAA